MFFARAILASLVLLGCLTDARYLAQRDLVVDGYLLPRQSSGYGRPSCRRICGSCGSSCSYTPVSKRDLVQFITFNDTAADEANYVDEGIHPLLKRTFRNVRQSTVGSFLDRKTAALVPADENPNSNLISLAYSEEDENDEDNRVDFTFATLKRFSDYTTDVLNIGTAGLEGCTVLTVVSPTAVYMAHFFESLAFAPDDGIDPNVAFQQNCLNLITGQGQTEDARGDHLDPSLFTGNNGPAAAFIMTPREDQPAAGSNSQLHAARIGQISQTLTNLIPGVGVTYYNYIAISIEGQTEQYQGKALFEYDPNADGNNNADFRLWYEQNSETGRNLGLIG
ncbi:hypothetical protein GGR54DRAFT_138240 [Hypoxylon sp. NC1633]|nr:hypothetical protein GGR54DRAFT_138240 [Hypoxylon sp. NC1633]